MDYANEKITPYNSDEAKTMQVRQMFDSIAPAYDFMNTMMSFGIFRHWRNKAVRIVAAHKPRRILDVATGTGDMAIHLCQEVKPDHVTGIDLSEGMLEIGRRKVHAEGLDDIIALEQGDCMQMRFADNSFDCVTVAYGVRNFEHLDHGFAEMHRVLAPGGMLCVIELSTPTNSVAKLGYNIYTNHVIPFVGKLKSHDLRAYRYLPESIAAAPQRDDMLNIMRSAGFSDCYFKAITFSTCTIYVGIKPQ